MPPSRRVLQDNLNALMRAHSSLSTNTKVATKAMVGSGTISRLRNAEVAASTDMLDALATAFALQPWQLLLPGLDPENLSELPSMSADERELFEKIKQLIRSYNKGK